MTTLGGNKPIKSARKGKSTIAQTPLSRAISNDNQRRIARLGTTTSSAVRGEALDSRSSLANSLASLISRLLLYWKIEFTYCSSLRTGEQIDRLFVCHRCGGD